MLESGYELGTHVEENVLEPCPLDEEWDDLRWAMCHLIQSRSFHLSPAHLVKGLRKLPGLTPSRRAWPQISEERVEEQLARLHIASENLPPNDLFGDDVDFRVLRLVDRATLDMKALSDELNGRLLAHHASLPLAFIAWDTDGSRDVCASEFESSIQTLFATNLEAGMSPVPRVLNRHGWQERVFLVLSGGGGSITLHDFVFRLCGLGRGVIRTFRQRLLSKYKSTTLAWEAMATCVPGTRRNAVESDTFTQEYVILSSDGHAVEASSAIGLALEEEAGKLFQMMHSDPNETRRLNLEEMQIIFAELAPHCSLEAFRVKLLLLYGSWQAAVQAIQTSGSAAHTLYGQLVRCAGKLDISISDLQRIFQRICPSADREDVGLDSFLEQLRSRGNGFSIVEFSIRLWLGKPDGMSPRHVLERTPLDAERCLRKEEFQAELFGHGMSMSKLPSEQRKILPVNPKLTEAEVAQLYETLRLEGIGRVTLNTLKAKGIASNVSDVLATNDISFSPGETAYIRYKVPHDMHSKLLEKPFIAMVSAEMRWVAGGGGGWRLRGAPLTEVDGPREVLPNKKEGVVCISIPLSEHFFERQEFRLFASPNGTRVGPQIGSGVSFDVLPPRTGQPTADEITHNSMRLMWAPPEMGSGSSIQISHYVVSVNPLQVAFEETTADSPHFTLLTTWNHDWQALRKTCSLRLDGLAPGMSYRASVVPHFVGRNGRSYEGPQSHLSDVLALPACIAPGAPARPRLVRINRAEAEFEVDLPEQDGGNQVCGLHLYRQTAEIQAMQPGSGTQTLDLSSSVLLSPPANGMERKCLEEVRDIFVQWPAPAFVSNGETFHRTARVLVKNLPADGRGWCFFCAVRNAAGEGSYSLPSLEVLMPRPFFPPSAPGQPQIERVDPTTIELRWEPPKDDGDAPVERYRVLVQRSGQETLTISDLAIIWQSAETQNFIRCRVRWSAELSGYGAVTFAAIAINAYGESSPSEHSNNVYLHEDAGIRLLSALGAECDDLDGNVAKLRLELGSVVEHHGGLNKFMQVLVDGGLGPPPPEDEIMMQRYLERGETMKEKDMLLQRLQPMGGPSAFLRASEGLQMDDFCEWLQIIRSCEFDENATTETWNKLIEQIAHSGGAVSALELFSELVNNCEGQTAGLMRLAADNPEDTTAGLSKLLSYIEAQHGLKLFVDLLEGVDMRTLQLNIELLKEVGLNADSYNRKMAVEVMHRLQEAGGASKFLAAVQNFDMRALADSVELAKTSGIDQKFVNAEGSKPVTSASEIMKKVEQAGGMDAVMILLHQAVAAGGAATFMRTIARLAATLPEDAAAELGTAAAIAAAANIKRLEAMPEALRGKDEAFMGAPLSPEPDAQAGICTIGWTERKYNSFVPAKANGVDTDICPFCGRGSTRRDHDPFAEGAMPALTDSSGQKDQFDITFNDMPALTNPSVQRDPPGSTYNEQILHNATTQCRSGKDTRYTVDLGCTSTSPIEAASLNATFNLLPVSVQTEGIDVRDQILQTDIAFDVQTEHAAFNIAEDDQDTKQMMGAAVTLAFGIATDHALSNHVTKNIAGRAHEVDSTIGSAPVEVAGADATSSTSRDPISSYRDACVRFAEAVGGDADRDEFLAILNQIGGLKKLLQVAALAGPELLSCLQECIQMVIELGLEELPIWRRIAKVAQDLTAESSVHCQSINACRLNAVSRLAEIAEQVDLELVDIVNSAQGGCVRDLSKRLESATATGMFANGPLNELLLEVYAHGGAFELLQKLRMVGSLDRVLRLMEVMGLSRSIEEINKGLANGQGLPATLPAARYECWEQFADWACSRGGPKEAMQTLDLLGNLEPLARQVDALHRLQALIQDNNGDSRDLNDLCDKLEESGSVRLFLVNLRGCSINELQQNQFVLDVLKRSMHTEDSRDTWQLFDDRLLLERFFDCIASAGGIVSFLDAVDGIDMQDFPRCCAVFRMLQLEQTSGPIAPDEGRVDRFKTLLHRVSEAGGMAQFLRKTEHFDMSRLSAYARLLEGCGLINETDFYDESVFEEQVARWITLVRCIRQEEHGPELFEEIFGCGFGKLTQKVRTHSLRSVKRCLDLLRQMNFVSQHGDSKMLERFADAFQGIDGEELLAVINDLGYSGFRDGISLLKAMRLGDGGGSESHRLWNELCGEVNRRHGVAAFLAYIQALQKHVGLCRYCQASSSHLSLLMVAKPDRSGVAETGRPDGQDVLPHMSAAPASRQVSVLPSIAGARPLQAGGGGVRDRSSRASAERSVSMPALRSALGVPATGRRGPIRIEQPPSPLEWR